MSDRNSHLFGDFSERFAFRDWPNKAIPKVTAGVYAIWKDHLLVYCGMSGRGFEEKTKQNPKEFGLITRLRSHASGRLSGDKFCVYVANRLVIPNLCPDDLNRFSTGEVNLDQFTKTYIHKSLDYQYCLVSGSTEAYSLESLCRRGEIFGQKPLLNPAN